MALLNWSWGEWKETLDKELAAEPTEPSEPSVKDPLSWSSKFHNKSIENHEKYWIL